MSISSPTQSWSRFRAKIPYPIIIALLAFVMATVYIAFHLVLDFISGTPDRSHLLSYLVVIIFPVLYTILGVIGRLSGYRPFVCRWKDLSPTQAEKLCNILAAAAPETGFQVCWQKPLGGLVAVLNLELEKTRLINDGKDFPTRLSLFIYPSALNNFRATMKISGRTVCVWDSGERANCARFGQYFTELLKLEDPALFPTQIPARENLPASSPPINSL